MAADRQPNLPIAALLEEPDDGSSDRDLVEALSALTQIVKGCNGSLEKRLSEMGSTLARLNASTQEVEELRRRAHALVELSRAKRTWGTAS